MKKKGGPVIKCNECGRIINNAKPKQKKAGDIEYLYLQCARCRAVYTISATDTGLREDIRRFKEMVMTARDRKLTEKEMKEAQELLQANMARNREIKAQYPLEIKWLERGQNHESNKGSKNEAREVKDRGPDQGKFARGKAYSNSNQG